MQKTYKIFKKQNNKHSIYRYYQLIFKWKNHSKMLQEEHRAWWTWNPDINKLFPPKTKLLMFTICKIYILYTFEKLIKVDLVFPKKFHT